MKVNMDVGPESQEGEEPSREVTLVPPPPQSRTLFHYFKRTKPERPKESEDNGNKRETETNLSEPVPKDEETKEVVNPAAIETEKKMCPVESKEDVDAVSSQPEVVTPRPKFAIGNFFKKVSREEYSREMSNKLSHSIVVTAAEIHDAPTNTPGNRNDNRTRVENSRQGRKRHCSNVSRCSEETDLIEIIESVEEIVADALPAPEVEKSKDPKEKSAVQGEGQRKESKQIRLAEKKQSIGKKRKKGSAAHCDKSDTEQSPCADHTDDIGPAEKISSKLFKKKSKRPNQTDSPAPADLEVDSVAKDMDEDMPAKVSPQLFKQRPKSKRRNRKVIYDSDSIDVDVLSTLVGEKAFAEVDLDYNTEEPASAFTMLMKKPLSDGYVRTKEKKIAPVTLVEQVHNKENTEQLGDQNNAFVKLMSKARRVSGGNELPSDVANKKDSTVGLSDSPESSMATKQRSRKRKVMEEEKQPPAPPVEPPASPAAQDLSDVSEVMGRRRSSARISQNREAYNHKREEQEELEKLLELELDSDPRRQHKRNKESKRGRKATAAAEESSDDEIVVEKVVGNVQDNRSKKLASIFVKGKKVPKFVEDPDKVAARKAFLLSSVPDSLRTQIDNCSKEGLLQTTDDDNYSPFSELGHIRQIDEAEPFWNLPMSTLPLKLEELVDPNGCQLLQRALAEQSPSLTKPESNLLESRAVSRMNSRQIHHLVKSLKMLNDTFPVYKVFRRFVERRLVWDALEAEARIKNVSLNEIEEERSRCGGRLRQLRQQQKRPRKEDSSKVADKIEKEEWATYDPERKSSMQWTMKYAPETADDVIGNTVIVRKLQTWLEAWKIRRRQLKGKKKNSQKGSRKRANDSFVVSSTSDDGDSSSGDSDEGEDLSNTALLVGPSGIGKTSSVHALALQLGFKVLEVNASSLRNGRQVLAQLHEATQSHHVHKHQQQTQKDSKKKRRRSGSTAAAPVLNKTALILFEDIDIVFEDQDDGFYGAVNSIIATTKRPIVLTTSNPHFYPRKFLKLDPQVFVYKPVPVRISAQYLQLLSLAEGFAVDCDSLEDLIVLNMGVISRSILDLQYWAMSGGSGTIEQVGEGILDEQVVEKRCPRDLNDSVPFSAESPVDEEECLLPGREDAIAKLLALREESSPSCAVRPQKNCATVLLGLGKTEETCPIELFRHFDKSRHLWSQGFGEFYEKQKYNILPFGKSAMTPKNHRKKDYKRIRSVSTTESLSEDSLNESKGGTEEGPVENEAPTFKAAVANRDEVRNARMAIEALSRFAEVSSLMLPFTDDDPWWTQQCGDSGNLVKENEFAKLGDEIAAYLQHAEMTSSIAVVEGMLGVKLTVGSEDRSSLPSLFGRTVLSSESSVADREVLNAVLPDINISLRMHVVDTLPAVRTIVRLEEARRAGKGQKKSRSGRFYHYFDGQEICIKPASLQYMCDAFL